MEIINKDLQLISLVEKFPHLYDKTSAKYKDRTAVDNSWLFISEELQVPIADCIARWSSLRNRFSKERAKKIPSGSATHRKWPLLKHLAFLHSVVKKRRTFGNIAIKEESNSSTGIQDFEPFEDKANSLIKENDSIQYIDYEYLTNETDSYTDIPSTEESLQSLSDSLSEKTLALIKQQSVNSTTPHTSIAERRPITPNTSTPNRSIIPHTSTAERSITPTISTPNGSITSHTFTSERSIIPNTSTSDRLITSHTSTPKRLASQKRKHSDVEEQLGNAVDIFKSFVTHKNAVTAEDESLKYFCDSLYGDLKNLDKKDLISCKIEIMQIISRYAK